MAEILREDIVVKSSKIDPRIVGKRVGFDGFSNTDVASNRGYDCVGVMVPWRVLKGCYGLRLRVDEVIEGGRRGSR